MKILVIEDEQRLALSLKKGMEEQEWKVELAYDGLSGKRLAASKWYDAIVLDINLPGINGYDLCREIRESNRKTPILMLTAMGTTEHKLTGFNVGADDYLVKPFEFLELVARLKALHKRSQIALVEEKRLVMADLEVDTERKTVRRGNKAIELTAREFNLLVFLLKNRERVVSRLEIAEAVWDISFDTGTNVIDVYINFLRKKIDKDFSSKLIHTIVNMGYVMREAEK
jgi:two-component system, OmpR family, copper resistance phosphate regulon response regulator CusR